MIQFEELIEIDDEELSFSFIQLDVDLKVIITVNKNRRYFVFDMKQEKSGAWKLLATFPSWVFPLEAKLSAAINKRVPAMH